MIHRGRARACGRRAQRDASSRRLRRRRLPIDAYQHQALRRGEVFACPDEGCLTGDGCAPQAHQLRAPSVGRAKRNRPWWVKVRILTGEENGFGFLHQLTTCRAGKKEAGVHASEWASEPASWICVDSNGPRARRRTHAAPSGRLSLRREREAAASRTCQASGLTTILVKTRGERACARSRSDGDAEVPLFLNGREPGGPRHRSWLRYAASRATTAHINLHQWQGFVRRLIEC